MALAPAIVPSLEEILEEIFEEKQVVNGWKMSWQQKYIWTKPWTEDDRQSADCAQSEDSS